MRDTDETGTDSAESSLSTQPRHARLGSYEGMNIGVCIFLSTSDLRSLNVDPDSQEEIEYQISECGTSKVVEIVGAGALHTSTSSISD